MLKRPTMVHRIRRRLVQWLDRTIFTIEDFRSFGPESHIDTQVHISNPATVSLGARSAIYRGSTILTGPGVFEMGNDSHLAGSVYVNALRAGVFIGHGVAIGPFSILLSYSNAVIPGISVKDGRMEAKVVVEDDVFIGAGVTILPGVTIGEGAVIGAGSVVTRDVAPNSICAGVPARPIGNRI